MAEADLTKGKVLFLQCRACHSLVPEIEPGKIGPTLYGVLGRTAGTAPGFVYSEAVAQSGIVWTPEQIDHWLERPSDFLPGNKMVFVGIGDPQDRANIIAYIQQESAKPAEPSSG
jgi:cytochrome c